MEIDSLLGKKINDLHYKHIYYFTTIVTNNDSAEPVCIKHFNHLYYNTRIHNTLECGLKHSQHQVNMCTYTHTHTHTHKEKITPLQYYTTSECILLVFLKEICSQVSGTEPSLSQSPLFRNGFPHAKTQAFGELRHTRWPVNKLLHKHKTNKSRGEEKWAENMGHKSIFI